jgi:hypothetical protein
MFKPEVRIAKQNAFCRACDKEIVKGTPMISWYSYRNRGMYIHLHKECATKIGELVLKATVSEHNDKGA